MENIDFEYIEKGEYAPRENYPWVKRENIAIIVQYKDEYLFLAWNEVNYQNSLVTGGIKKKEKKEDAIKRELEEETGYVPEEMQLLASFYQDQGCSAAYNYSMVALECEKTKEQNLDKDEIIRYFECSFEEAVELVNNGYITDLQSQFTIEKAKGLVKTEKI